MTAAMTAVQSASTSELRVLSAGIIEHEFPRLAARFESETGYRTAARFNPSGSVLRWIQSGESCDVVVLSTLPQMQQLFADGLAVPESYVPIGKAVIGVAVKEGAPAFDISTPEAIRTAVLKASSFAHANPAAGSSSGAHVRQLLRDMGIADEVCARIVMRDRGQETIRAVGEGLAQFVIAQSTEIAAVPGVRYLGPLPPGIQAQNLVGASLLKSAASMAAGRAFLEFIGSGKVRQHWRSLGFDDP